MNIQNLTETQRALIKPLINSKLKTLEQILPDTWDPAKINPALETFAGMLADAEVFTGRLKVFVGRLLALARRNPEVYTSLGHTKFEDYRMAVCKKTSMGRTNASDGKMIVEHFPNLAMEKYDAVGPTKLMFLCKFLSQDKSDCTKILDYAQAHTLEELKAHSVKKGYLTHGQTYGGTLLVTGDGGQVKDLNERIAKYAPLVGSDRPIDVILAAFDEASTEWDKKAG